jgi:hypothetical protein
MFKLVVYIPEAHTEAVKQAMFAAGAGRQGNYDQCSWQVKGEGQFRPLEGSQPFVGDVDTVETVAEYRVEMLCEEHCLKAVIKALKNAHPYEEPAFDIIRLQLC